MANKPYSLQFQADFATMIRDATKAGKSLEGIFKKAAKIGFSSDGINKIQDKVENLIKKERHLREELEIRVARVRAKEDGRLEVERTRATRKLAELERKLQDESQDEATKKKLQAEKKVAKLRHDIFKEEDEFIENMDKASKNLLATVRGMERSAHKAGAMAKNYEKTADRLTSITKYFNGEMLDGADQFIEKLSDGLDGLAGKLTSSVDAGALFKGGAQMASKGITAMGDALGTMVPILGTIATGLAGVVAIAGVVGAIFFEADKKVKEFNKSAINTFGVMDLARIGGGDLNKTLLTLNRTVHNLTANLGITSEEAMGLLDALDKGGLTLSQLTSRSLTAANQQTELAKTIVNVGTTARMMGVGIAEYSSTLMDYVNDLGTSLDTVNDSFSSIAKMAADSSFGTRRFYSMVVQATSGQASLNTRLEDTAGLLIKMTKILGQKKAMEMAGQHQGDLENMSTQDRHRLILTTGAGRMRKNIQAEANRQGRTFGRDAARNSGQVNAAAAEAGIPNAIREALTAGMVDNATPEAIENLTKQLRTMTKEQTNMFVASLSSRTNAAGESMDGLGRRLGQLVTLSRGTTGNMSAMSDSLSAFSTGGSIVARLDSIQALTGHSLDQMTGVERMMAESTTGVSGAAFENLQRIAGAARGQFKLIQKQIHDGVPVSQATQDDLAKRFGATVDANGRIRTSRIGEDGHATMNGDVITDERGMISASMNLNGEDAVNARSAQDMLMQQTADATLSIGDILENKIYQVLMDIAGWGTPFMRALSKYLGADTSGVETVQAISQAIQQRSTSIGAAQKEIAATTTAAGSATGSAKKALLEKKAQQEKKLLDLQSDRQALVDARDRVRGGNDYDRRSVQYQASTFTNGQNIALGTYGTEAEARTAHPMAETHRVETLDQSPQDTIKRTLERAASWRNGTAPGAPAAPGATAATAAPTSTPTASNSAPVAVAPANQDTNPTSTEAVTAAVADASSATATATADTHRREQTAADRRQRAGQQHMTQMLTRETKLGDALARSKLPGAIVDAQVRQQLMAAGTAAGMTPEDAAAAADQLLSGGELNDTQRNRLSALPPESLAMLQQAGYNPAVGGRIRGRAVAEGAQSDPPVDDFIYRGNGANGSITPIDTSDQFVGLRPGGAIDQAVNGRNGPAGRGGGGGNFTVHIHGGDERRVFDVVKRVLQQSGISPNRGTPGA